MKVQAENEPLLSNSDDKNSVQRRRVRAPVVVFYTVLTLFCSSVVIYKTTKTKEAVNNPSVLSVVHHETLEFLSPLDNPLYEELKHAKFYARHGESRLGASALSKKKGKVGNQNRRQKIDTHQQQDNTTTLFIQTGDFHQSLLPLKQQREVLLSVDKTRVAFHEPITVSWSNDDNIQDDDVIALYCHHNDNNITIDPHMFHDAATIAQARASTLKYTSRTTTMAQQQRWYIHSFPILRESSCEFFLWRRIKSSSRFFFFSSSPRFVLGGISSRIFIPTFNSTVTALHISLGNLDTEMIVSFTTGAAGIPIVEYHETENGSNVSSHKAQGVSTTYQAEDMCEEPATSREPGKFLSPGMLHTVRLTDLKANTKYTYRAGVILPPSEGEVFTDDEKAARLVKENVNTDTSMIHWTNYSNFQSALSPGSETLFQFLVYGDQGCPTDGWALGGQIVSDMIQRENDDRVRMVHHIGDLSYAQGAAHIWDEWFAMVQGFASRVPLMIGIGNHEYDYTSGKGDPSGVGGYHPWWGNFFHDSGGECGVPTSKRFHMPETGNGVFWYFFDYGTVRTIVLSSEHDLHPGSDQYLFLKRTLEEVNREVTPWLIVECHRPMYNNEYGRLPWSGETFEKIVGRNLRREFEFLLAEHKVNLFLSGHYHSYLRLCNGLYKSKCHNGGPLHITVGTAGARLDGTLLKGQKWAEVLLLKWGYGRITVANSTALRWEFVSFENDGEVLDDIWVWRD